MIGNYLHTLEQVFRENADPAIVAQQKAYMRNQFEYTGIKTPNRRIVCRPFLTKAVKQAKVQLEPLVKTLWLKQERDYQYHAQELVRLYRKDFEAPDIELLEWMAENKSWWDTVDFIAADLMGAYFSAFPGRRDVYVEKWMASGNIWL